MTIYSAVRLLALGFLVLTTSACSRSEAGSCPAPDEDTMWVHIYETNGFWSQTKCLLCDAAVPEEDWLDWATDNADPGGLPSSLTADEATPCLYVYSNASESEATCEAAVCSGNADVNDPVQQGHGAWSEARPYLPNASSAADGGEDLPEGGDEEDGAEESAAEAEGAGGPVLL